ncbi:MAG: trypsin-like peptidase domain-containing protein [Planctomycetia bacterium]|nr:trypsin-like peptidase domain-containing protein [Planctomycetia bacterium]
MAIRHILVSAVAALLLSLSAPSVSLAISEDANSLATSSYSLNQAQEIASAFRSVAQKVLPATVKIIVKRESGELSGSNDAKLPFSEYLPNIPDKDLIEGVGSGFIVDPNGLIVTNNHVVVKSEIGKIITVEMNDGRQFIAQKIVKDEKADVALIRIESDEPLPFLSFADSDAVEIGDWAIAIGNPFMLGSSVSVGIISATERYVSNDSKVFLQTDAAVNPGNSGGPLVNLNGEVVGVNTAIASVSGGYQGVGFAIPANTAKWAYTQLRDKGKVERAFLGAAISPLDYNETKRLKIPPQTGLRIDAPYKDTPAAKAGLRANDVLLSIDDRPIQSPELFRAFIERADVNREFTLKILRNNSDAPIDVKIRFEIKPENYVGIPVTEKMVKGGAHHVDKEWGLMLIPSTPESVERLGASGLQGLVVLNVIPGGVAYRAGIRNGMLITKLNSREIASLDDYLAVKNTADPELGVEVETVQKGQTNKFRLKLKKQTNATSEVKESEIPDAPQTEDSKVQNENNANEEQPSDENKNQPQEQPGEPIDA